MSTEGSSTLRALADAKDLPLDFLQQDGIELRSLRGGGVSIPYFDENGDPLFKRQRDVPGRPRFAQPAGVSLKPYGLWRLADEHDDKLFLVEGETDALTLWYHRQPALGLPGSGAYGCLEGHYLKGFKALYIIPDNDEAGEDFKKGLIKRLQKIGYAGSVWVMRLPDTLKDTNDLHRRNRSTFLSELTGLVEYATKVGGDPEPEKTSGGWREPPEDKPRRKMRIGHMADLTLDDYDWLVPGYFALGVLTLIVGEAGQGKSFFTLALAAELSRGRAIFGGDESLEGDTLLITSEDNYEKTVLKRLIGLEANIHKVHYDDGIEESDGSVSPFYLKDHREIEELLEANPTIRLVIIDPASSYIGDADDYKETEIRGLLRPLAEMAIRQNVAILLVKHLNRRSGVNALGRLMGSAAWGNTSRAVFLIAADPNGDEGENRKLLISLKFNTDDQPPNRVFRIKKHTLDSARYAMEQNAQAVAKMSEQKRLGLPTKLAYIEVLEEEDFTTAEEAMAPRKGATNGPQQTANGSSCAEWLKDFLGPYVWPSKEVMEAGAVQGFSEDVIWRARKKLGVKARKTTQYLGGWLLRLPEADEQNIRPESPFTNEEKERNEDWRPS